MCLPEAARVLHVGADDCAVVSLRGAQRRIPLILLTSGGVMVRAGDWLLLHTGLAVARISAAEAARVNSIRNQGVPHE